jgi:hypothetical protein
MLNRQLRYGFLLAAIFALDDRTIMTTPSINPDNASPRNTLGENEMMKIAGIRPKRFQPNSRTRHEA